MIVRSSNIFMKTWWCLDIHISTFLNFRNIKYKFLSFSYKPYIENPSYLFSTDLRLLRRRRRKTCHRLRHLRTSAEQAHHPVAILETLKLSSGEQGETRSSAEVTDESKSLLWWPLASGTDRWIWRSSPVATGLLTKSFSCGLGKERQIHVTLSAIFT